MRARAAALCGALLALAACDAMTEAPAEPPAEPLPPGTALPPDVDAMLYGNGKNCRQDDECPGDVCYFGACVGMLVVDQRWMQEQVSERLAAAAQRSPELRDRIVLHLVRVLERDDTDLAFRARALLPLERLGALDPLRAALDSPLEPLADAAALALARAGDPRGVPRARALTESEDTAVAAEALRALGRSRSPEALVPLLRTLEPALDGALLRSALDGLAALGDPRAIRPLIDFLPGSPDYLRWRVVHTLRELTGAALGLDGAPWRAWLAEHPQPPAPAWTPRPFSAEQDLGLPTP
ncbi:MAG: HEAT repeat domain-containing protein [Deltaproteobacteria bacterium]|nr:HEAT repeat domain-containing protein [Deltaproteobacteria bacterium]MCB9786531.1 HEAT repeat domain-containing protein [Deltaproteobacteria bacterium]